MVDTPDDDDFEPLNYGGFLSTGNGRFSFGAGVRNISDNITIHGATAIALGKDKASIGLSIQYDSSSPSSALNMNAGLMWKLSKKVNLGVAALSLLNGQISLGAGLSFESSKTSRFVVDTAFFDDFSGLVIAPGIQFGTRKMAVSLGVGLDFDDTVAGSSAIATGMNIGFDFSMGSSSTFGITIRQINQVEMNLSFRFK